MSKDEFVIYGLHIGDHRYRYIGLTCKGAEHRLKSHKRDAKNHMHLPVYRWMVKHGKDTIQVTVLETSSDYETLKTREIFWIADFREKGFDLLNLTDGGEGRRMKLSDEHKAKISSFHKGHKYNVGKTQTPESNEKRRQALLGKPRPDNSEMLKGNSHAKGNTFTNSASKTSAHKRWHTNKGISKPDTCNYCKESENDERSN